jgi:hypothetical protein
MNRILRGLGLSVVLGLGTGGCSLLTPELIAALSKDTASFCAQSDIRGGVGTILTPAGGYGQSTLAFCRSNYPDSLVTLKPDGSISIQHGKVTE